MSSLVKSFPTFRSKKTITPITAVVRICALVEMLPLHDTYERGCLQEAHAALTSNPPDVGGAINALLDAREHTLRLGWIEDRLDSWLALACLRLLSPAYVDCATQRGAPRQSPPTGAADRH